MEENVKFIPYIPSQQNGKQNDILVIQLVL